MKKLPLSILLMFSSLSTLAHAYAYSNSPASTANPPESIEQDQAVPTNPNIYGPAKPLNPPQGTIITPSAPIPAPTQNTDTKTNLNQTSAITPQAKSMFISMSNTTDSPTNADTKSSTETPNQDISTPTPNADTSSSAVEGDTTHDPDPESDDTGTTPNQAS